MATYNASVTITSAGIVPEVLVTNGKGKFIVERGRQELRLESGEIHRPLAQGEPVLVRGVATVPPPAIGAFYIDTRMTVVRPELPALFENVVTVPLQGVYEQSGAGAQ